MQPARGSVSATSKYVVTLGCLGLPRALGRTSRCNLPPPSRQTRGCWALCSPQGRDSRPWPRTTPPLRLTPSCLCALATLVHPWGSACFLLESALSGSVYGDRPTRLPSVRPAGAPQTSLGSAIYKQNRCLHPEGKPVAMELPRPPRHGPPGPPRANDHGSPSRTSQCGRPVCVHPRPGWPLVCLALAASLALCSVPACS